MAVTEPICEAFNAVVTGYLEILELARQQCEAIRRGQLELFLKLLEARFVISERLRDMPAEGSEIAEIKRQVLCLDNLMAGMLRDAITQQAPGYRARTA